MKPERKTLLIVSLYVAGVACICIGVMIMLTGVLMPGVVSAQESADADEYAGTRECTACHTDIGRGYDATAHAMSFFEPEDNPEAVIADFSTGEEIRLYQFPDEATGRAFTLEDIAYVVGSGRTVQRYLIEVEEDNYQVLPAQWRVDVGEWEAISIASDDHWQGGDCATCHTTGYNADTHQWVDEGVTCESCHGAGMDHVLAADDAGGNIDDEEMEVILSAITTHPAPETCGTCHTQPVDAEVCDDPVHCQNMSYEKWLTSPHAEMVMGEEGETFAVTCSGCHGVHGNEELVIASTVDMCLNCHESDANRLMAGAVIVENVTPKASAHHDAGLECESCHDPHGVSAIPDDPDAVYTCSECHSNLTNGALRNFVDNAQENVETRLTVIDAYLASDTPEWVMTAINTLEADGSHGVHNFAYTSRLLDAIDLELGIRQPTTVANMSDIVVSDAAECAECHSDTHATWQNSMHANASLSQTFQREYAANGQPSYCMSCHASGYDPETQTYVFDGVVCSTCHQSEGSEHPPAPMSVASDSQACGTCHSGEHSPEYNEWLMSDHSLFNIDCVDCHVAHDNSLRLNGVNETCADCHKEAMNDEIHMGDDMTCVECHMTRTNQDGTTTIQHTMFFDPKTCADCHGDIHTLQRDPTRNLTEEEQQMVSLMQEEIHTLETKADTNLQSGIVGGAIGAMVLVGFLFIAVRFGRIR